MTLLQGDIIEKDNKNIKQQRLKPIDAPIISIFAAGLNCGQIETELMMRDYFVSKGYEVLYICGEGGLLSSFEIRLPPFLFETNIEAEQKIIMFNKYMYDIYKEKTPDLILLHVPNPILKYNDDILNGMGVLPFIVQSSVKSDIGVLCMNYINCNFAFLQRMSQYCEYHLCCKTNYFCICDIAAYVNPDNTYELDFLKVDKNLVTALIDENVGGNTYSVFTLCEGNSGKHAFTKIEEELSTNPLRV